MRVQVVLKGTDCFLLYLAFLLDQLVLILLHDSRCSISQLLICHLVTSFDDGLLQLKDLFPELCFLLSGLLSNLLEFLDSLLEGLLLLIVYRVLLCLDVQSLDLAEHLVVVRGHKLTPFFVLLKLTCYLGLYLVSNLTQISFEVLIESLVELRLHFE